MRSERRWLDDLAFADPAFQRADDATIASGRHCAGDISDRRPPPPSVAVFSLIDSTCQKHHCAVALEQVDHLLVGVHGKA